MNPSEQSESTFGLQSDRLVALLNIGADAQPDASRPASVDGSEEYSSESPGGDDLLRIVLGPLYKDYEVLAELPRGGQAVVYKAIHRPTGQKVALKILSPNLRGSVKARRAFEREVDLVASLQHPGIVTLHNSGVGQGQYYFSMAYIHGQRLDDYCRQRDLDLQQRVGMLREVCQAVTYAHQRGVIHRDLKPSNILVDEHGAPKVVDFGLAKSADLLSGPHSLTGEIKGTTQYMAPEQAAGRPDQIDVRSDVYALGVMMYELFTGRLPYDVGESTLEGLRVIQEAEPMRPRQFLPRFDRDLEAIVLKAIAKERERRYQSAGELAADLDHWRTGRPVQAQPINTFYVLRKLVGRHRIAAVVCGLLLVIFLGFASSGWYFYRQARQAQAVSRQAGRFMAWTNTLSPEIVFVEFMAKWQQDRAHEAASVLPYFTKGTRERVAMQFLLDDRAPEDKQEAFRAAIGREHRWFADYCLGEDYLKRGQAAEALASYQQAYAHLRSIKDVRRTRFEQFIANHLQARLLSLSPSGESP